MTFTENYQKIIFGQFESIFLYEISSVTDAINDFLLTVTAIVGLKYVWFYITHGPTLKMNITYLE